MGSESITRWGRKAVTRRSYLGTDRGPVGKCRKRIRKFKDGSCGVCGVAEMGWHLVFECPVNRKLDGRTLKGLEYGRIWMIR